jgi:hypothetical protein
MRAKFCCELIMASKTNRSSQLEMAPREAATHCAGSEREYVIRISLTDDLLASNPKFRALVKKSKASPRKPFPPKQRR